MGFQFGQRLCDCEAWTSLSQRAAPVRGARMPKATFVVATLAELVTTAYVTGVLESSLLSPGPRFYGQPASSLLTLEICSGSGRLSAGLKQLGVQRFWH